MGTPVTIKSGLYDFSGVKSVEISDEDITKISELVFKFNKGEEKRKQKLELKAMIQKYQNGKSTPVACGCTELAVMARRLKNTIDPMDILIEEIIKRVYR